MLANYVSRRCLAFGVGSIGVWLALAITLPTLLFLYNGPEEWALIAEINNVTPLELWVMAFLITINLPARALLLVGVIMLLLVQLREAVKDTPVVNKLALPLSIAAVFALARLVDTAFNTGFLNREVVLKTSPILAVIVLALLVPNLRRSACNPVEEGNS